MVHLFVLFPSFIILAVITHILYQKHPETVAFYYFRNAFGFWTVCTFFFGIITVANIQAPLKPLLGAVIGIPFYYISIAYLIRLPFAIYKRMGIIPNLLSALVVIVGISVGVTNYFTKVVGDVALAGALSGLVGYIADIMLQYRMTTTALFLIPVGLFFIYESTRAVSGISRVSAVLIGLGIMGIGIFESMHVFVKHASAADFGVGAAFMVMLAGLSLPFLLRPAEEVGVSREAPSV